MREGDLIFASGFYLLCRMLCRTVILHGCSDSADTVLESKGIPSENIHVYIYTTHVPLWLVCDVYDRV